MSKLKWTGKTEFLNKLKADPGKKLKATAVAAFEEGNRIMTKAKPLTPVDKGPLRASGSVNNPVIEGQTVVVNMGFGGPSAPYAIIVHEDLNAHHTVGQAKFLEQPLNESTIGMADRIAARVKEQTQTV